MGTPKPFPPAKLVVGVLASGPERWEELLAVLRGRFGREDYQSAPLPFTATTYYDREMGVPIVRRFVAFERLVAPDALAETKLATNAMEHQFAGEAGRTMNLDPGTLDLARFVLATTKDRAHRIAIGSGIFAELELLFEKGAFRPLEWTYPDYRTPAYLEILSRIREILRNQLRRG